MILLAYIALGLVVACALILAIIFLGNPPGTVVTVALERFGLVLVHMPLTTHRAEYERLLRTLREPSEDGERPRYRELRPPEDAGLR